MYVVCWYWQDIKNEKKSKRKNALSYIFAPSFCHFHGTVAVWKFVRRTILGKYGYRVDVPTYLSNEQ